MNWPPAIPDPRNAQAKAYLGDIYFRHHHYQPAVQLLEEAIKLQPSIRVTYLDLGIIYTYQKQYARAAAALQRAIRLDPQRADAHYRLAITYHALGREAESEAEQNKVAKLQNKTRDDLLHKISGPPPVLSPSQSPAEGHQ